MVVRWKNKDGTGGVLTRPYTWEGAHVAARLQHLGSRRPLRQGWPEKRAPCSSFHQSSEPTSEAYAMKLTKQLALQLANLLDLSALAPDEDLDRHAVREIAESLFEGRSTPSSSIS